MKKALAIFLAALMLTALFTVPAFAADVNTSSTGEYSGSDGNIDWTLSEGKLTISGTGEMNDYTTSFGGFAPWYDYRTEIQKIQVNMGVTTIGSNAFFYCSELTEVAMSDDITSIGSSAFCGCGKIEVMNIPLSTVSISTTSFSTTNIKKFIVPTANTVFYTEDDNLCMTEADKKVLFKYASGKDETSFSIPDTIQMIANGAFEYTSLETINIPSGVDMIGNEAFSYNESLKAINVNSKNPYYSSKDGVLFLDKTLLIYPEAKTAKSYTVPSGTKSIGPYAFEDNKYIQSVTLPDSVSEIYNGAFYNCESLKSADLGKAQCIDAYAFFKTALTSVYIPKTVTELGDYSFGFSDYGYVNKSFKMYYVKGASTAKQVEAYSKNYGVAKAAVTIAATSLNAGATKAVKPTAGTARSWTSNKKSVAAIKKGKVYALKKGTATITITLKDGAKVTGKVTVKTNPKLSKSSVTVKKGKTVSVKITGKSSAIKNAYTNTKIAKITSAKTATTLKVKGLKQGTTTLTVKVNGYALKLKVKVS